MSNSPPLPSADTQDLSSGKKLNKELIGLPAEDDDWTAADLPEPGNGGEAANDDFA